MKTQDVSCPLHTMRQHPPRTGRLARLLSIAASFVAIIEAGAQLVTFPDANLESAVREALNSPSGGVTEAQMLTLTNLFASDKGIGNTTGLETARHLDCLVINGNPVTNFTGFGGLTNLTRLDFVNSEIKQVSFLAPLQKLETLYIYGNEIQDVSPLAPLANLRLLQLDWNPVTNHAVLGGMTNLTSLSVAGHGLTNLAFLEPLRQLEELSIYFNQVRDISALSGQTNLRVLSAGWNGITNPAVVASLSGLQRLWLGGNSLTNASFVAGLTNLIELGLDYTDLADMSPLAQLAQLEILNVGENHLASLPDLSGLSKLSVFMIAGNQLADLSPLTNLSAVTELHLQRNVFGAIAPLAQCENLRTLLLSGNELSDLAEISALTNLQALELRSMQLSNLDCVLPLTELRWLDAGENQIRDVSAITNLPWLDSFGAEQNRLLDISPLLNCPSLWNLNVTGNYLDITEGSVTWNVITNFLSRGISVEFEPQNPPPVLPIIVAQPLNRSAFAGRDVTFSAIAGGGSPPLNFNWEKDGAALSDSDRISGAQTETLQISSVTSGDSGFYRLAVWDEWLVTNTITVQLIVVTNVAFADSQLEAVVRDYIAKPGGPIAPDDLAGLESLDTWGYDITSLSGIEALADLIHLNLPDSQRIGSFEPLAFLASLRSLALINCGLDDLDRVPHLPFLEELDLGLNFIQDISPLGRWTGLRYVWLNENQVTQIAPLLAVTNLVEAHVPFNRLDTNSAPVLEVITALTERGVFVEFDPQLAAPNPPVISQQPSSLAVYPGADVSFYVAATGSGQGLSFRWQKDSVNLADGERIQNSGGDTLFIDDAQPGDAGNYRVRIWDELGVIRSRTVTLRVITSTAFVDPQLELAVRDRLGVPSAPLTLEDLAGLDWLEARNYGITNLSGIESAANLNWLLINGEMGISDFTPLAQLPALQFLELSACRVGALDFVAALAPLNELNLWGSAVEDISPLLNQPQVTRLNLGGNPGLANLSVLNSLAAIEALWLDGAGISNLECIAFMPNLRELNIYGNWVQDIGLLAGATHLVTADLGANQITDAFPIASCTNLQWLSVAGNQVSDISFVTNLTQLWAFHAQLNPITNGAPLLGMTNITQLNLSATAITNFAPVSTLTRLAELWIWQLGLTNAGFLQSLTNLSLLHASDNLLPGLTPFPHFSRLRYLNLDGNPLETLSFISGMTNLNELFISGTGHHDLAPLSSLAGIQNLGLANNAIASIVPLQTMPLLRWVTLYNNNLQEIEALGGFAHLEYADIRENLLDVFAASPALALVQSLQSRAVTVEFDPQKPGAIFLLNASRDAAGFHFDIHSAPNSALEIWSSTNLASWAFAGTVTNDTGAVRFSAGSTAGRAFFRARVQ